MSALDDLVIFKNRPIRETKVNAANLNNNFQALADYADEVAAAGLSLGYAEITSNFTQTGAGNSDVTGLSVTVTVGTRPIIVKFDAGGLSNSSASGLITLAIKEGSTILATAALGPGPAANCSFALSRDVRLSPSAGSHTYKINLGQIITGNSTIGASATNPASIHVVEV